MITVTWLDDSWIGLVNEEEWRWFSGYTPFTNLQPATNEPSGDGNCVEVVGNSKWNDIPCNLPRFVLCQLVLSTGDTCPDDWLVYQESISCV